MANIYLASSWRNTEQPRVCTVLRGAGHKVYDFRNPWYADGGFAWSDLDPDWKAWTAEEYRKNLLYNPIASHGYNNDMRAMEWADTCVLLLPSGRSAHLEAGWFCGRGKRCVIHTRDNEEPELMALMATEIVITDNELLEALQGFKHG